MAWLVLFFILLGCGSGESGQPLAFWRLAPANNMSVSLFFFFFSSFSRRRHHGRHCSNNFLLL
jgi:hypothetical protein